jgi:HEPN domain-containing protein
MGKMFDKESVANSWTESAERDWKTMNHLVKSKDYAWSLFLGHLVIEKLLKALIVKKISKHLLPII